jgi:hypothetical protein
MSSISAKPWRAVASRRRSGRRRFICTGFLRVLRFPLPILIHRPRLVRWTPLYDRPRSRKPKYVHKYVLKTYGTVEAELHLFLTTVLDNVERSVRRPAGTSEDRRQGEPQGRSLCHRGRDCCPLPGAERPGYRDSQSGKRTFREVRISYFNVTTD